MVLPTKRTLMAIRKVSLATAILIVSLLRAAAGEVKTIPEIGVHQPILIVRKNVRPHNLLVVYTKEDGNGRFIADQVEILLVLPRRAWIVDPRA